MADQATEEQKGESPKQARFWRLQLSAAEKREESWHKTGQEVQCRYLDDRDNYTAEKDDSRRVNILWSVTETQKGMLFSKLGNPDVSRLFPKSGNDNKVARDAALVIERTLVACGHRYDGDEEIRSAVEDQVLPGRGICWLEYEPTIEGEAIRYQEARFCHVDWKDFRHGSAKTWKDVPWVARPLLYGKEDLERDFPEHAEKIPLNYVLDEGKDLKSEDQADFKRARIWEIWYKPTKIRVYIADDYELELKRDDDPYRLDGFFPVPRPLYGVKTASTLTPRPEFLQWQDQAAELDRVNTRIWRLLERMKYCGIYDATGEGKEVLAQLGSLKDGQFIGIKNLRNLANGEGLAAAYQTRDLAPIAASIQACSTRAMELLNYIYEVTGISDLMRGATDAEETYGAQNLKARFGSQRQQCKQAEVQRFVRDLYRLKGELIAEHFEREVLEEMSGVRLPLEAERAQARQVLQLRAEAMQMAQQAAQKGQQAPRHPVMQLPQDEIAELEEIAKASSWEEVSGVLRSDDRRNYKIDIQSDLTAMDETVEEKQLRVEFLKLATEFMAQTMQMAVGNPMMATMMRELFMHATRSFKTARTLEEVIDDTFAKIGQMPAPQGQDGDPIAALEAKKLEAVVKEKQLSIQAKQQDMALDQQKGELELQALREKLAMESDLKLAQHALELQKQQTAALKEQLAKTTATIQALQKSQPQPQPQRDAA